MIIRNTPYITNYAQETDTSGSVRQSYTTRNVSSTYTTNPIGQTEDADAIYIESDSDKENETKYKQGSFSSQLDENTQDAFVKMLENIVTSQEEALHATKENNGIIAQGWDWFKNTFNVGASSNKAQNAIDECKEKIEKLKNGELTLDEVYKHITGNELDQDEFNKLVNSEEYGSVDYSKSDFLKKVTNYQQGQKQVVNTISSIATVVAVTVCIALAPFSGGLSLGLAAVAAGTAAYMVPQAVDGLTEKDGYSGIEIAEDLATGLVESTIDTITMGTFPASGNIVQVGLHLGKAGAASAASNYLIEAGVTRLDDLDLTDEDQQAFEQISNGMLTEGDEEYEEALEKAQKYYEAVSNNADLSTEGLLTTTATGFAAGAAAGMAGRAAGKALGSVAASNTTNTTVRTTLANGVVKGGISGTVAGASGAFVAGGTNYILTTNAEDQNVGDWFNASMENVGEGAVIGLGTGMLYGAVENRLAEREENLKSSKKEAGKHRTDNDNKETLKKLRRELRAKAQKIAGKFSTDSEVSAQSSDQNSKKYTAHTDKDGDHVIKVRAEDFEQFQSAINSSTEYPQELINYIKSIELKNDNVTEIQIVYNKNQYYTVQSEGFWGNKHINRIYTNASGTSDSSLSSIST